MHVAAATEMLLDMRLGNLSNQPQPSVGGVVGGVVLTPTEN